MVCTVAVRLFISVNSNLERDCIKEEEARHQVLYKLHVTLFNWVPAHCIALGAS